MTHFDAEVAIDPKAISQAGEKAHEFLLAAGVDQRAAHHVALILDEILTNVLLHGGAPTETANIQIDIGADSVKAEICDPGLPFDPRTAIDAGSDLKLEEREVGGLGLRLVRNIASELNYRRDGNRNCTCFSVRRILDWRDSSEVRS